MAMQAVMSLPCSSCAHCPPVGQWRSQGASVGGGGGNARPILKQGIAAAAECGAGAGGSRLRSAWLDCGSADPSRSSIVVASQGTAKGGSGGRRRGVVRCTAEPGEAETGAGATTTAPPPALAELNEGDVNEVDKDSFWPIVHSAAEKVVVLDMYTQWCGPCKLMLPKLIGLATAMDDVIFCKLECNKENKPLAKELGIRVVPTFKIFKNHQVVGEVTGAKFQELVNAIEKARKM